MKIVVATGGTGGHIFPALCVATELKSQGHEIMFVGVFGPSADRIRAQGFFLEELPARGLTAGSPVSVITTFILMAKSWVKSKNAMGRWKPDAVLGFGGYGAFPVVLAAVTSGIPAMIHEQNVVPGRANRILSRMVNRIAVSFDQSRKYFPFKKTVLTGCPCRYQGKRHDRGEIFREFGLEQGRLTMVVIGGSQGSRAVNQAFVQMIPALMSDMDFQVIHISGAKNFDELAFQYGKTGIKSYLTPFLEDMDKAYTVADVVVSRAGALTITELALFGIPAVLIPYPFAGGHQKANAQVLVEAGTAEIMEEHHLTPEALKAAICRMAGQGSEEFRTRSLKIFQPHAAELLAREVNGLKEQ